MKLILCYNLTCCEPHTGGFLPYLLTPRSRVLLEKLTGFQLVKKYPHFMESESSLSHLQLPATCPRPEPDQYSPCPHLISWRFILILSSHLRLGLPRSLFLSGLPTKIANKHLLCPICATRPTHLIFPEMQVATKHYLYFEPKKNNFKTVEWFIILWGRL
jgi:hypothetical protein